MQPSTLVSATPSPGFLLDCKESPKRKWFKLKIEFMQFIVLFILQGVSWQVIRSKTIFNEVSSCVRFFFETAHHNISHSSVPT